ncbi:hypothetical protein S83_062490 [Arachis hypogaea]
MYHDSYVRYTQQCSGYISPEYAVRGSFSMKSDVFAFGVIVLEVVSGRKTREFCVPDQSLNLLGFAWELWNEERTLELVDESLRDSVNEDEVLRCIQIGLLCVQERPEHRPNMSSVVRMLDDDKPLPRPRLPAFYSHQQHSTLIYGEDGEEVHSANEVTISLLGARNGDHSTQVSNALSWNAKEGIQEEIINWINFCHTNQPISSLFHSSCHLLILHH